METFRCKKVRMQHPNQSESKCESVKNSSSASAFASSSFAVLLAVPSSPFTSDREVYEAVFVSEKRSFDHSIASEEPARYLLPVLAL